MVLEKEAVTTRNSTSIQDIGSRLQMLQKRLVELAHVQGDRAFEVRLCVFDVILEGGAIKSCPPLLIPLDLCFADDIIPQLGSSQVDLGKSRLIYSARVLPEHGEIKR